MKKVRVNTYSFSELSHEAKEKAREWYRNGGLEYHWYEPTAEDAEQIVAFMGISNFKMWFSGFSSQGDGACFEGSYNPQSVNLRGLKAYAPKDKELHRIGKVFAQAAKQFPSVSFSVVQSGHYQHSGCTDFSFDFGDTPENVDISEVEADLTRAARDTMDWIYKTLEREYDYLNSDEAVDESIEANDYAFTSDGSRSLVL